MDEVMVRHAALLGRAGEPGVDDELLSMWASAEWSQRRMMFAQIDAGASPTLVPTLARIVSLLGASGQRDLVRAMRRIGGVAIEPTLEFVLRTSAQATKIEAVDGLAEFGTPFSEAALRAVLSETKDPIVSASILNAIDRIHERHPRLALPGAISLVEDDRHGALSIAGVAPGDVTLYARALEALERSERRLSDGANQPRELAVRQSDGMLSVWESVAPAPRPMPSSVTAFVLLSDHVGQVAVFAALALNALVWFVIPQMKFAFGSGTGEILSTILAGPLMAVALCSLFVTPIWLLWRWSRRNDVLKDLLGQGDYTTALVIEDEERKMLAYVDDSGVRRVASIEGREQDRFTQGDRVPMLVNRETDTYMAGSQLRGLEPQSNGELRVGLGRSVIVLTLSAFMVMFVFPLMMVFVALFL